MAITGPRDLEPIGPSPLRSALSGANVRRIASVSKEQGPAETASLRVRNLFETGLRLNNQKLQEVQGEITRNQLARQNLGEATGLLTRLREAIESQELNSRVESELVSGPVRTVATLLGKDFQGDRLTPEADATSLEIDQLDDARRETALARLDGALEKLDTALRDREARVSADSARLSALTVERENLTASISQDSGGDVNDNLSRIREELDAASLRVSVGRENVFALIG